MQTAPRVWLSADYNQAESRVVARKGPVPKLDQWYREGVDVHSYVCRLIAKVVQENHIQTPINPVTKQPMFMSMPWNEYKKGTEERELAKRTVHGSNYDMGIDKLALVLGVSNGFATVLYTIYHALFPEIKRNYHAWVRAELTKTRTIWMPHPVKFRKVFHAINKYTPLDNDTVRSAYSCYPQCIVGALLVRTLNICCKIFVRPSSDNGLWSVCDELKPYWQAWYGYAEWDRFALNVARRRHDPWTITRMGMDIRLNVHDSGVISVPDDPDLVAWAAHQWRTHAEVPIHITDNPEDWLVIPSDFKKGPTFGSEDLKDYELPALAEV